MPDTDCNLTHEVFTIDRIQKEKLNGHKYFVLWLTGLSVSGKSTIARYVGQRLFNKGVRTIILDGDNTRLGINKDLDFSEIGRAENIRRVAEISCLMNSAGLVVIASFISPLEKYRLKARSIIGNDSFIEIFIDAPVDVCIERDPKGLYRKALNGEFENFTGGNSPDEAPVNTDIHLKTGGISIEDAIKEIGIWLTENHFLKPSANRNELVI